MKRMINSNPLEFEGLRHNQKVQRAAAQIYKTPRHNNFVQAPLAQLTSGENKERPPLTMEPSIDIILNVMPAKAGIQTNEPWIPDPVNHWSGMTERRDGMLG